MKRNYLFVALICFFLMGFVVAAITADPTAVSPDSIDNEAIEEEKLVTEPVTAVVEEDKGSSFGKNLWLFLNSPIGLSVIAFILTLIGGKIFTAKPKWKSLVLKYGPQLMQAVKLAEKKITTDSGGLSRLDDALEYIIKLEPKLAKVDSEDIKKALTTVHAKAEASGNIKVHHEVAD
ncbi:MAG: hypothetical protein ACTSO3_01095 [Candidatus Heimdallarchaeaceae archaeon]